MIAFLRAARVGAVWLARNPMLALLFALVFLLAAVGIRSASLSNRLERAKARAKELQDYKTTRERIDDAPVPTDAAAARRWLRSRKH